jgi:hypothetical protein
MVMSKKCAVFMAILAVFMTVLSVQAVRAEDPAPVDLGIQVTDFVAVGDTIYAVGPDDGGGYKLVIYNVNGSAVQAPIQLDFVPANLQVSGGNAYVTDSERKLYVFHLDGAVPDDCSAYRERYKAKFDWLKATLTVPYAILEDSGVEASDGQAYSLVLQQRGSSNNFEVTFVELVPPDDTTPPPEETSGETTEPEETTVE